MKSCENCIHYKEAEAQMSICLVCKMSGDLPEYEEGEK